MPQIDWQGARDALAVLADVLGRDGQQLSASQTWQQALADADHLAILHAIWTAETAPAREQHYKELLMSSLPPQYQQEPGHQAKWLWRTMRAAELAGLDPGRVLADAIAERDLAGARDVPSVLDARLRHRAGALVPRPAGPWSAQLPKIPDPERRAYAAQIAAMMDARKDRIGEHAADSALPWAVSALGPVPGHPVDRLAWQRKASSIGAYRELSGYHHPDEPIGPEPTAAAPDIRAAWHEALAALGPVDGPDVRGMPDGTLLHLRDTYPIETGRSGSATNSARSASAPPKPAWRPSAPAPRPAPPSTRVSMTKLIISRFSRPATRPCTTPTQSARPCSPPSWPPGPTGSRPPAPSGSWPWPPTPICAAAIPNSSIRRCARPNPRPPPRSSAPSSP